MQPDELRKKIVKTVILWSVVIGGLIGLMIPTPVSSNQPEDPCQYNPDACYVTPGGDILETVMQTLTGLAANISFVSAGFAVLGYVIGGLFYMFNREQTGMAIIKYVTIGFLVIIFSFTIVSLILFVATNIF
jgi:hypothetical protein